ncbi:MAG: DUF2294 domain-containing protein [Calditrichaeota bacterium]|nr:MAG: DUF2294 domain-containing protein [Calditrichota bacterium]
MQNKNKGQIEQEISNAITRFEKEHLGRGPRETRTFIVHDMILVRLKDVLTPAEARLAVDSDGAQLIKQIRLRLIENSRSLLEKIVEDATGAKVVTLHTDISTRTGERIFVFGLNKDLERELKSQ